MLAQLTKLAIRLLDAVTPRRAKNPRALPEHLLTGQRGEEAAYFYLRKCGYVIVARNWKSRRRKGEIDLVGWDGDTLCFIEVKTRTTHDVKPAEAAVDRDKQRELRAMAREYLWRTARCVDRATSPTPHRFDVVSVYYEGEVCAATRITLFQNAFAIS